MTMVRKLGVISLQRRIVHRMIATSDLCNQPTAPRVPPRGACRHLARAGDLNTALELRRAALAKMTRSLSADQRRLAPARAQFGATLIRAQRPAAAELHLRAVLQVQQEESPGEWTTFRTQALLGAPLLGPMRYTDAEPP